MIDVMHLTGGFAFASDKIDGAKSTAGDAWTPCSRWTLRQLINHLIAATALMGRAAAGAKVEPRAFRPEVTAELDFPGGDAKAAFDEVAVGVLRVLQAPRAMEATVLMPFGETPARVVAGMVLVDSLVHGWDVARSSAQDATIPGALARVGLEFVRGNVTDSRRGQAFGAQVSVPAGASPSDQLVAFLGRDPSTSR